MTLLLPDPLGPTTDEKEAWNGPTSCLPAYDLKLVRMRYVMVIRALGATGSCDWGMPSAFVRTTMSMGFSSLLTDGSTFFTPTFSTLTVRTFSSSPVASSSSGGVTRRAVGFGVFSLIVDSVISFKGVACRDAASGDAVACGVGGSCDSSTSGAIDTLGARLLRAARASFTLRRLGGDFLVGDNGSSTTLSGGLKICDGSICETSICDASTVRLAPAARLRGVVAVAVPVVLRLGDARVVRAGAGVNSSSSAACAWLITVFSTSELLSSSTTTLRRAARRTGRSGEAADIATGA